MNAERRNLKAMNMETINSTAKSKTNPNLACGVRMYSPLSYFLYNRVNERERERDIEGGRERERERGHWNMFRNNSLILLHN